MSIKQTIKRAALIAIALVLEAIDKHITEEQNKTTTAPDLTNSSKYTFNSIKPSQQPIRQYRDHNGIITTTTSRSRYTADELRAFYKINPYTNNPYEL